ncbi:MAG TPA: hypothetical protein VFY65_07440 [Longimicrobium sp.]|nr:hypothetical protein [Longimicrobium sp.]
MALPFLRPLAFGEILDGAFQLYRRHFATFAVTTLIPTLALMAGFLALGDGFVNAMTTANPEELAVDAMIGMFVIMTLGLAASLVMWPALTRQAAQAYTGQPTSVADGFRASARTILPLLGAAFLAFAGMIVAAIGLVIVLMIVMLVFGAMGSAMAVVGMLLVGVGYFAYLAGAAAILFAIVPAIVVEGAGPWRALERSFTLARGALGRVAGVLLVAMLIAYLPVMAVMALTGGFAQMMDPSAVPSAGQVVAQQMLAMGVGILTTPFLVAVIVLLYFDRRVRTEALDVQMATDSLAVAGG